LCAVWFHTRQLSGSRWRNVDRESWRSAHDRRSAAVERGVGDADRSDAEAAIAWYKDALGARELWNLGGVAGLEIDGAPFFLHEVNPSNPAERSPDESGTTSTRIELFVDDPGAVRERAIAAGASPGSEIEEHKRPWGTHRQGGFRDPFGHKWSVGDKSPLPGSLE
jgi:PhnB protein